MTLIAASLTVDSPEQIGRALGLATDSVAAGAHLIEWRIDRLAERDGAAELISGLIRESPAPSILTCRRAEEGGGFTGSEAQRRELIAAVIRLGPPPRYVDLELASFEGNRAAWLEALQGGPKAAPPPERQVSLILSLHDFDGRPPTLLQSIERMAGEERCSVIKVAWMARSLRDNLEAFDLLAARHKPTIALCMGRFGLLSRVLAPKFNGFITFATAATGDETAPGQPTVEELLQTYRFDTVKNEARVYGVIGWPVDHSLGPLVHNDAFARIKHAGIYLPLPVPGGPEAYEPFKATVGEFIDHPRLNFHGASVTIPHKENLLRFVEERGGRIDPNAALAGAANTLLVGSSGAIACRNTDASAIVETLADALNVDQAVLSNYRIAILGAGGVARAAIAGLIQHGAALTVFNRTETRAGALAIDIETRARERGIEPKIRIGSPDDLAGAAFDVFINCTSVGMSGGPAPSRNPLEVLAGRDVNLAESATVFDTVYTPSRTPLIEEAEIRGARVVLGIDLFLRQAALQFESWTGERAPITHWRNLLAEHVEA